ncbi:MAG: sensor histidine kinase [Pirellulales bacterium]
MSYRALKTVLGETNLERKCLVLFGVGLLVLIIISFWWYGKTVERLVGQQNRERGRLLVDTIMTLEHFDKLEANADFRRDVLQPTLDTMKSRDYKWSFIHPDAATGQIATRDSFEEALWSQFSQSGPPAPGPDAPEPLNDSELKNDTELPSNPDQRTEEVPFAEQYRESPSQDGTSVAQVYDYYQPIYATTACIDCHRLQRAGLLDVNLGGAAPPAAAHPPLVEGDLMAVVKINIPNGRTQQQIIWNRALLLAFAIGTVFLAVVMAYIIVRYVIVKPLKHLTRVSDEISRGNIEQRAEIQTGDEFETLALAFNRMLRHLVDAQQGLRNLNTELDTKVDELARVNMQLFEANRLKSDFLVLMSHELRTPLNSIIGFSDVLGSIDSLDDKQKRYVQNIRKSGKSLLDMINDILDLAKIESGKAEIRLSDFRLDLVIGAHCDMARPLLERKNIDLEVHIAPGLPEMRQDQGKLQQILNNLLSNAIKFTPDGGRINVSARRDDRDCLLLTVADTGIGISEEDQRQIFEKFRQGKIVLPSGDALTREYSGTGLGLSIVKELCKVLGGEVLLRSELGQGSVFTVRLPWTLPDPVRVEPSTLDAAATLVRSRSFGNGAAIANSATPAPD